MKKIWAPELILPPILVEDDRLRAAKTALEYQMRQVSEAAVECILLPRLDELPEDAVDLLAAQFHVDFYELDSPLETKRALVRDAIAWHRRKGTPAAVEEIVRHVFLESHVTEWYEYGGEPYFFRVISNITNDLELADRETLDRLRAAVSVSKNVRSWLEFYQFLVFQEDSVSVTDDVTLTAHQTYWDEYEYGRTGYAYDGQAVHGEATVSGLESWDFERLDFRVKLETGGEFERVREDASAHFTQSLERERGYVFDGAAVFDGFINYNGESNGPVTLESDENLIDREERRRWYELYRELRADFSEACTCGAAEYEWHRGYLRLGEAFRTDDEQVLTVEIRCARCGNIMADYVVPDERWEVRI